MKLLVDMNLSPRWVDHLTGEGVPAVHWAAVGKHDAPDAEIMAFAIEHECIVLTHDLDFSAILAATHGHKPSVIQIRADDVSPDTIGTHVIAAVKQMEPELQAGAILTVEPSHSRLRLLPLS
jgi:predicted nuclease of predicted toxin-antitoxin system